MREVLVRTRHFAILSVLVALPAAAGSSVPVPFDVQVPLVLKALTYDRNLKSRAGDHVRIAVLVPKGARAAAERLSTALDGLPDRTVNGLPVSFREVPVSGIAALETALRDTRWVAVYVLPGFTHEELREVRRVCEVRQILPVAAVADEVEHGMAFAIGAEAGKPQIVVNIAGSKACGSEFELALLRVSRVVQ